MTWGKLDQQVATVQRRLETLWQSASAASPLASKELLVEALTELSISLQELQVAEEEMRQQNDELAAERQRYQELFDFAPDAYLVTNPQGVIWEANHTAASLLQMPVNFLVGKPLAVFVVPQERRLFRERLLRLRQLSLEARGESWEVKLQPRQGVSFSAILTVALRFNSWLMQKLGITDLPNLVKFAIQYGLTSLE